MKNIVQISPYSFTHIGGVEQYAKTLQFLFSKNLISLAGWQDFPIIEPVKNFPLPAFWKMGFWKNINSVISSNTDIIISHIRFAPTAWLAFLIAKTRGIKYVHIEHGTGYLIHPNKYICLVAKFVDMTIGKCIITHADYVICISKAWEYWVRETFWRTKNISVIYRGFEFQKIERPRKWEYEPKKIGFVGRLVGLKNVEWLINALLLIREQNWVCEIVWGGEEQKKLEALVIKWDLSNKIKFIGERPHSWIMQEFYPTVDIFVNPSLQEWLPTTVIEALGMGCQVIATDVGGTREISEDIIIPPNNDVKLSEKIIALLKANQTVPIVEHFSMTSMKSSFHTVIESIWK